MAVAILSAIPVMFALPLMWQAFSATGVVLENDAFGSAVRSSVQVAIGVTVLALFIGLPLGVVTATYEFRGRRAFMAIAVLPLLVPTFLWSIGWSSAMARIGPAATRTMSGEVGCIVAFTAGAIALVLLTCLAAASNISASQMDAARLAGGERTVIFQVCRFTFVPSFLAAGLAGVLTLSDPGPGQILGLRTAAGEILTNFSALHDFQRAGRQCALLAGLVLILAVPLAAVAAPRLSWQIMPRQTRRARPIRQQRMVVAIAIAYLLAAMIFLAVPLLGLMLPLSQGADFGRARQEVARTMLNTLIYAGGAGCVATLVGFLLALSVGRSPGLKLFTVAACLTLLSLPPTLSALGLVYLSTHSPAWLDWLLRSRATVYLDLGFRFLPVAAIIGLRTWGAMPATWANVAGLHGVPLTAFMRKVVIPFLLPTALVSVVCVAILATADVGTVLLLHPPGETSLPLAIFTIMANAPESLVASLCLLYLTLAIGIVTPTLLLTRRQTQ